MKNKKKRRPFILSVIFIIALIVFIVSATHALEPYIKSYKASQEITQVANSFKAQKETPLEEPICSEQCAEETQESPAVKYLPDLWALMEEYNKTIFVNGQKELVDAWSYKATPFDLSEYGIEDGVVGVITIPKIDVELPLYIGATYDNLLKGGAILTQTSMPIGGENTNCVIAAHRGWNEIPFVRYIEDVGIGDSIFIENLWETLEYRVIAIKIIYPHEFENILIQEGRDLITLVTCHPYRVNDHRYLVYAERYYEDAETDVPQKTTLENGTTQIAISNGIEFESSKKDIFISSELPLLILFVIFVLFIVIILFLLIRYFWRKYLSARGGTCGK